MSKLQWDKTGERFYELGVDHGVLYPMNNDGTYGEGVVWNGLTGVTESPDGADANDLWADNIKYATLRAVETFGATIEAYTYPDEFAECDGTAQPVTGVKLGQQKRKPFGFVFRTQIGNDTASESDDGYLIHIIYNATASPSDRSYETINDSPDAITFSWEVTTSPVTVGIDGYKPVSTIVVDSRKFTGANESKLTALEDQLFGKDPTTSGGNDGITANLPSPLQVLTYLNGGTAPTA